MNTLRNHRITKAIFAILTVLLIVLIASAQDTQTKYQRKSISYIDALLRIGADVKLSKKQEDYLLKVIKREIEMSRFDYNPLPEGLLKKFKHEVAAGSVRDLDAVAEAMNEILAPEIMRIVDYAKEMRAQGLVSEAEQHSFVAEKAKMSGITAEDLEAVMNSAYIYLPVISQATIIENAKDNTATATLKGGILWFAIKTGEAGSSVDILVKKEADGSGFAKLDGKFAYEGRTLNGSQYAFATAAKVLARNLKVATQTIPEFQLTNPLTNTGAGCVEMSMGKREGLGVDDKFIIAEYYEQPDGSLTQKKLGMVRVSKVADNREKRADSKARTVIGGGYERGMLALEHPRLPIDLSFRFASLPLNAEPGKGWFEEDINSHAYVGQLWFNYNLARTTNVSQFFVSIYGELGSGKLTEWKMWGEDVPAGLYYGAGIGLAKKFYANRFHLGFEALASWAQYGFEGDVPANYISEFGNEYAWKIQTLGLTLNANLEIALGYDLNIGGGVSYRIFAPSDNWTYELDGNEIDLSGYENLPELDFSGVGFQVYFTWSLPSLGYDPLAAARGAIGY